MVEVDPSRVPRHVAIIMDGNGRWANRRGLRRNAGHEAGEEALFRTVEGALALGCHCDRQGCGLPLWSGSLRRAAPNSRGRR